MSMISKKLRNSANAQECTLQIPGVCVGGTETTVLCHAPSEAKGIGNKSPDFWAAFGCHACHDALDQHRFPRADEQFYWLRGIFRTWSIWIAKGLVILPVDPTTAKKRPKNKAYLPSRPIQSRNDLRRRQPKETGDG
jgi:hypothetical protein